MRIFCKLTPKAEKKLGDFPPFVVEEEKVVWSLYRAGVIRDMGYQPDPIAFCFTLEEENREAANVHLSTFPMVQAGLLDIELIELHPWMQIEALFKPEALARS